MGLLSFIPIIGNILDKGLGVVDKYVPDKDKANEIKAAIKNEILVNRHEETLALLKGQVDIILAETKGNWIQRSWRPLLMLTIITIILNNYVIFPYLEAFTNKVTVLQFPNAFWNLLTVGVGGYIGGRTYEKVKGKA